MDDLQDLLRRFFANSNKLCQLREERFPKDAREAISTWRKDIFSTVERHNLVGVLSEHWIAESSDPQWSSVTDSLCFELRAVVALQYAALSSHGSSSVMAHTPTGTRSTPRGWRFWRVAVGSGSSLVGSIQAIFKSLPPWANGLLEVFKELFDLANSPSG